MAAIDDVYTFIETQALAGGATGWALFRRRLMDGPGCGDQIVVVSEDGGMEPEIKAVAGLGDAAQMNPGVMVTVRAAPHDGDASGAKALAILNALHGKRSESLVAAGQVYLGIRALSSEPVFAGADDRGRPLHTVAFRLLRLI